MASLSKSLRSRAALGAVLLALAFGLLVALVSPFHNTPVQDDWDYTRTVGIFMRSGDFQRSEIAQATEIFTTLYGALFADAFGLTFVTLRMSTLVLSLLSVLVFYGLLGELGFEPRRRVLGALCLLVSPLFLYLSFTFMTDVPALFWTLAALYMFTRAQRSADARLAFAGSLCASLAFLTRQLGLVVALAAAAYFAWRAAPGQRLRFVSASAALPLAVAAIYAAWLSSGGSNWANAQVTVSDTEAILANGGALLTAARRSATYGLTLSFYLLPLGLAAAAAALAAARDRSTRAGRWDWLFAALAGLGLAFIVLHLAVAGQKWPYFADGFTGAGLRPYLGYFAYEDGSRRPDLLPALARSAMTALLAICTWALASLAFAVLRRPTAQARPAAMVYWIGVALALPTLLFAGAFERYALPLLPIAIVLLLDVTRRWELSPRVAAVGLAAMALWSVALLKDFWGWMDARWTAAQALVAQEVPLDLIDGGYEWDAWELYDDSVIFVHQHDLDMSMNPWSNIIDPEYLFSFTSLPGYRISQEIDFDSPFGPDKGRFFILRSLPGSDVGSARRIILRHAPSR